MWCMYSNMYSFTKRICIIDRDALVLGVTEKEAKDHFHAKLQESRRNSFHVSMNWFLHGLAKDNRQ